MKNNEKKWENGKQKRKIMEKKKNNGRKTKKVEKN